MMQLARSLNCFRRQARHRHTTTSSSKRHLSESSSASPSFLQQLFSLQGKCAIVTGGGTGIGAALAMALARAGASVVLTGRREKPLQESQTMILKQLHADGIDSKVIIYPCDITNFMQIPDLVHEAEYLTGIAPTILINNAGTNVRQPAESLTSDHFRTSFDVMLTAPFILTRALSQNMKKHKYGRVISLASLQSYQSFPNSIPYAAAKSGILGLTRALSEAYSPIHGYEGVTVNAISPGYVQTELTATVFADAERAQRLADSTVLGRNSVPEDLMGAVVFLASPAASYITGQTLSVDGGFTALGMR